MRKNKLHNLEGRSEKKTQKTKRVELSQCHSPIFLMCCHFSSLFCRRSHILAVVRFLFFHPRLRWSSLAPLSIKKTNQDPVQHYQTDVSQTKYNQSHNGMVGYSLKWKEEKNKVKCTAQLMPKFEDYSGNTTVTFRRWVRAEDRCSCGCIICIFNNSVAGI